MTKKISSKTIFKFEMGLIFIALMTYILYILANETFLTFNCDNYFQLAHGNYVLHNGFPDIEPLRMHSNFSFMMPQWLFSVMLTKINSLFGNKGIVYLYIIPLVLLNGLLFYQIINMQLKKIKKDENTFPLCVLSFFYIILIIFFTFIRPYIYTLFSCLLSTFFIEKYIQTKNWKYLIPIPFISIVEVNMHNSLWISLFLIQLCYYGEYITNRIIKKNVPFNIKPFLIMSLISFLAGLINPYGFEYILYIFPSMKAIEPFKNHIRELQSVLNNSSWILAIYFIDIIALVIAKYKNINLEYRFIFAFLGFGLMTFVSVRNAMFFFTFGQIGLLIVLSNVKFNIVKLKTLKYFALYFSAALIIISMISPFKFTDNKAMYNAVDMMYELDNNIPTKESVFTTFDIGSYALYKGYHVYLDTCAEIYGIENNHQKDIAEEFIKTFYADNNIENVQRFFNYYNFKYCVVDTRYFASLIEKTKMYKLVYQKADTKVTDENQNYTGGWLFVRID